MGNRGESSHDISTMSDLPAKGMRTKMWPMSPIETMTPEELYAVALRDRTPVIIGIHEGDASGTKYICGNKKGASVPLELAGEDSWTHKYFQQVAALNKELKDMKERFQPVWEVAKEQQTLLVASEIFDGLFAIVNKGVCNVYRQWEMEDRLAILTQDLDFRSHKMVDYVGVLRNFEAGNFSSLSAELLEVVEMLLKDGETYLIDHARANGFDCPSDVRGAFLEMMRLKKERNTYSHPLSCSSREDLIATVLQKLKHSVYTDEFKFIKGTKSLILMGAEYAEKVLENYGKIHKKLFLNPLKKYNPPEDSSLPSSPGDSMSAVGSPLVLTYPAYAESATIPAPLAPGDLPDQPDQPPHQTGHNLSVQPLLSFGCCCQGSSSGTSPAPPPPGPPTQPTLPSSSGTPPLKKRKK